MAVIFRKQEFGFLGSQFPMRATKRNCINPTITIQSLTQAPGPWDHWVVRGSGLSLLKYAYHLFMLQSVRAFTQLHKGEALGPHTPAMYLAFLERHVQEKQLYGRPLFNRSETDDLGWFHVHADFPMHGERRPYRVMMRVNFVTGDSIMGDCGNAECMTNAIE